MRGYEMGSYGSEQSSLAGFCDHSTEPLLSVLKKVFVPWR